MNISSLSNLDPHTTTNDTPVARPLYTFAADETLNGTLTITATDGTDAHLFQIAITGRKVGSDPAEIVGTPTVVHESNSAGASLWGVAISASGSDLVVTLTGDAMTTTEWVTLGSWLVTSP